jgi:hypothetical protein
MQTDRFQLRRQRVVFHAFLACHNKKPPVLFSHRRAFSFMSGFMGAVHIGGSFD